MSSAITHFIKRTFYLLCLRDLKVRCDSCDKLVPVTFKQLTDFTLEIMEPSNWMQSILDKPSKHFCAGCALNIRTVEYPLRVYAGQIITFDSMNGQFKLP